MESENKAPETLVDIARTIPGIYKEFTESVQALGTKAGKKGTGSGKMSASFAHWIGGSHVRTEREMYCEQFLANVEKQLEFFSMVMEGSDDKEINEGCNELAWIMTEPRPSKSDSTTDLMKRAMIGHVEPYLPYVSLDVLENILTRLDAEYNRFSRLPIEKQIRDQIIDLIQQKKSEEEQ